MGQSSPADPADPGCNQAIARRTLVVEDGFPVAGMAPYAPEQNRADVGVFGTVAALVWVKD